MREFLTADQVSGGRVGIGLGAGVIPDGPAKPLTHLRSAVDAIRASLDDATNPPGWVSTPPVLIAGSGDNLLGCAGERGDAVGNAGPFPPHPTRSSPVASRCSRLPPPTIASPRSAAVPGTASVTSTSTLAPSYTSPPTARQPPSKPTKSTPI